MAAKKTTAKAENQENKELETQSTQDGKNEEPGNPETPIPEVEGNTPNQEAGNNAASEPETSKAEGDNESTPAADTPAPQDGEDEALAGLEELQMQFRTPGWQHAALTRYQGWEPGKKVTKTEYAKALKAISNRPQGGGRVV